MVAPLRAKVCFYLAKTVTKYHNNDYVLQVLADRMTVSVKPLELRRQTEQV